VAVAADEAVVVVGGADDAVLHGYLEVLVGQG
jgi:hypothetical protein